MKNVYLSIIAILFTATTSMAHDSCQMALNNLSKAQAGYNQAMAIAQNAPALCGSNNDPCYYQVSMAVNMNVQAVQQAQQQVAYACGGGDHGHDHWGDGDHGHDHWDNGDHGDHGHGHGHF